MSLHPDNAYCLKCGGVDLTGMGSFGRKLKSRCRCDEDAEKLTETVGDPLLRKDAA